MGSASASPPNRRSGKTPTGCATSSWGRSPVANSAAQTPRSPSTPCGIGTSLFSHLGEQIRSFKGSWKAAVKRAGDPDLLFHDFRRSGIRNLKGSGVSDSVAIKISRHKTDSVFRRYDIVDEADLSDAADKIRAFRATRDAQKEAEGLKSTATISATVQEKEGLK